MTPLFALLTLALPQPTLTALEAPLAAPVLTRTAADGDKPVFSYTFVEANYLWTDFDAVDDSLDGWEVRLSLELFLNLFVQGSYSEISDDVDLNQYRVGVGYHLPLGSSLDLYGILSLAGAELDGLGFDDDEDGIAGEAGLRFLLSDQIELNGKAEWVDIDGSEVGFGAGGRFYFTPRISAGLNVDSIDENESFAAGLRFQF